MTRKGVNKTNHHCVSVMKKAAHTEKWNKVQGERMGRVCLCFGILTNYCFSPFFSNCYIFIILAGPKEKRGDWRHFSILHIHRKFKTWKARPHLQVFFWEMVTAFTYEFTLNIKLSLNIWLYMKMDNIIAPLKQLPQAGVLPFKAKTLFLPFARDDGHTSVNLKCSLSSNWINKWMHAWIISISLIVTVMAVYKMIVDISWRKETEKKITFVNFILLYSFCNQICSCGYVRKDVALGTFLPFMECISRHSVHC